MLRTIGRTVSARMCCIAAALFILAPAAAQALTLRGTIYDDTRRQPVDFGTVIVLEAQVKARTAENGSYTVQIPEPGEYTVIVQSEGLRQVKTKIRIDRDMVRDFRLGAISIRGAALTITGERDIQKVSRYTMTVKELKEVPASFGDSISALTSLPGVIRTDGFFGPLVIRGGLDRNNNYFIDDIPIYSPLHFGGLHSVINNNLMSEIDLFSSAFPAQYGSANAAVISINTVDSVKEFGGYADIGLISASGLVQTPILKTKDGKPYFPSPTGYIEKEEPENAGYLIVSGRYGYLSLLVPTMYYLITGDKLESVPDYWDYQVKGKYYLNSKNSISVLFMGSKDYFVFTEEGELEPSDDPLLKGFQYKTDKMAHGQGLYYTWQPNERISNRLVAYASLTRSYTYLNLPSTEAAAVWKDINITSLPYVFGLKDRIKIQAVEKILEFRGGPEYTVYHFVARGKTLQNNALNDGWDPADPDQFTPIVLDEDTTNQTVGGYIEAKLTVGGLTFVPGFRSEYLDRSKEITWDPRGMLSYEFPTGTTLSVAAGKYSYFFQTNPNLFDFLPHIAKIGEELESEKALHRVAGIEQAIGMWTIKLEGFYNNYWNLAESFPHYTSSGEFLEGLTSGKMKAYGFEVLIKNDLREDQNGIFGWANYTYTQSKYKSGLPWDEDFFGPGKGLGDPYGDRFIDTDYEQEHAFKLVLGYRHNRHQLSGKFQYYTSLPYYPIVGAEQDTLYPGPGDRYVPKYGTPNSARFEAAHRLDLRYTYKINHSWGYVSWYVELINVYNHQPKTTQEWDYRYAYSDSNPKIVKTEGLTLIPNFGVEVKF